MATYNEGIPGSIPGLAFLSLPNLAGDSNLVFHGAIPLVRVHKACRKYLRPNSSKRSAAAGRIVGGASVCPLFVRLLCSMCAVVSVCVCELPFMVVLLR